MRIQKMENLNSAFDFMHKKGLLLTNIGSSDILDGNRKLILGLLWTMINKFQVTGIDVDGVSGKDGLLLWCQRSLADYDTIEMKNFTTSWTDGLAFCGLIHKFHPQLLDFAQLQAENAQENVELAFRVAEEKLGIPQLLEVSDVANHPKPDDKIIVTYVSLLFQEFASGLQKKKAVATICRAIGIAQRHEQLRDQYDSTAESLYQWINEKIKDISSMGPFTNANDIKQAIATFNQYKKEDRAARDAEYVALESCASRWIASCKINQRDPPAMNPSIDAIQTQLSELDRLELEFETNLRQDLERFETMELTLRKVSTGLSKLETWYKSKTKHFEAVDALSSINTTAAAAASIENYTYFDQHEYPRYKSLLEDVKKAALELSEEHSETASMQQRLQQIETLAGVLTGQVEKYYAALQRIAEQQHILDAIARKMVISMRELQTEMEDCFEELESSYSSQSVAAAVAALESFEQELKPKILNITSMKFNELKGQCESLTAGERQITFPGSVSMEQLTERITKLEECNADYENALRKNVDDAKHQDELCQAFAQVATDIKTNCVEYSSQLNQDREAAIEDYLISMKQLHKAFKQNEDLNTNMKKIQDLQTSLDTERVFHNSYTRDTIQSLRAQYSSLNSAFSDKIEALEKEIVAQKAGNLTPEQLVEIQEVFNHFDLDEDGLLSSIEFTPACQGLGLTTSEEDLIAAFNELDIHQNDEVTFSQFSKFCASQLESGSTQDDVMQAFETLSKETYMTEEQVDEYFESETAAYLKDKMPRLVEDHRDYKTFTQSLFSESI